MLKALTRRRFCGGTAAIALMPFAGLAAHEKQGLKPLIKYRGGKSKELSKYLHFIPEHYATYYEPFVGGGATFFALMLQRAVIGDINEPLINFYRDVGARFDSLSEELAEIEAIYERNQTGNKKRKEAA